MPSPRTPRRRRKRSAQEQVFRWAVRVLAIAAGVRIEYQQVFEVSKAQPILVGLGLWLMAVPPAMWADQLRRFIPGQDGNEDEDESEPPPA